MKQYKLIVIAETDSFEKVINRHLKEGWELQGNLVLDDGFYTQAMIKQTEINA